jgi:hypothetical protein
MDPLDVLELVRKSAGLFEAYRGTTFKGHRDAADGGTRLVTIEVWDAGPGAEGARYHVVAADERGRTATGTPADSIEVALAVVRWGDLDRDR